MRTLLKYNYIYLIPLFLSAAFSLSSFRLKAPKSLKIFAALLIGTFITEAFAIAWKWGLCENKYWGYSPSNLWIYNAFLSLRYLFIIFFFYEIITSPMIKRLIVYSAFPILFYFILNYAIIQTPHRVNTNTIIIANAAAIFLSLKFLFQILADKAIIRTGHSPEIWICCGTLIYYSGTLPLFIFLNFLITDHRSMALSFFYINDVLNIFMYLFYLIAFLCQLQLLK